MNEFQEYLNNIEVPDQRIRMEEVFRWIDRNFPLLARTIKWNQPMYTDHGTLIIGFSRAKKHMAFTPEEVGISLYSAEIEKSGYEHTKGIVKIKWSQPVDYDLLRQLISFNIQDKAECNTFFRSL